MKYAFSIIFFSLTLSSLASTKVFYIKGAIAKLMFHQIKKPINIGSGGGGGWAWDTREGKNLTCTKEEDSHVEPNLSYTCFFKMNESGKLNSTKADTYNPTI